MSPGGTGFAPEAGAVRCTDRLRIGDGRMRWQVGKRIDIEPTRDSGTRSAGEASVPPDGRVVAGAPEAERHTVPRAQTLEYGQIKIDDIPAGENVGSVASSKTKNLWSRARSSAKHSARRSGRDPTIKMRSTSRPAMAIEKGREAAESVSMSRERIRSRGV